MKRRASIARPAFAWCCALCDKPRGLHAEFQDEIPLALMLLVARGRRRAICLRCARAIVRRLERV